MKRLGKCACWVVLIVLVQSKAKAKTACICAALPLSAAKEMQHQCAASCMALMALLRM